MIALTIVPLANFTGLTSGDPAVNAEENGEEVNASIDHSVAIDPSIPGDANPIDFRDIKDVVLDSPAQQGLNSRWYLILPVFVLVIACGIWTIWNRFGVRPSFQQWALEEVDRLKLRYGENPDQAYGPLCSLVREYLRSAHDINAPSQTTEQLIESMRDAHLSGSAITHTEELLGRADRYRFSRVPGHQTPKGDDIFELARSILEGQPSTSAADCDGTNRRTLPQRGDQ